MLGTLLEKTVTKTKFELDGSIKYPPTPVPILEMHEKQVILDKIKEIVKSLEITPSASSVFVKEFEKIGNKPEEADVAL